MKVRPERFGQKPRCHMKVFIMRLSQAAAIGKSLVERGRNLGNAVVRWQRGPSTGKKFFIRRLGGSGHGPVPRPIISLLGKASLVRAKWRARHETGHDFTAQWPS